jgi:hypothetical protein
MRTIVTLCAVVALCAPAAAHAQDRGRGRDVARLERDDEHGGKGEHKGKGKDKNKEKCKYTYKENAKGKYDEKWEGNCDRHDNGRHLALGHDRRRADDHRDRGDDRDRVHRCVDANRDGVCDSRVSSPVPPTAPSRPVPFPMPTPKPVPVPLPAPSTGSGGGSTRLPTGTPTAPMPQPTTGGRRALPAMVPVSMIEQKRRTGDQEQWLGSGDVPSRYVDANRNGIPEQIDWLDRSGWLLQVWRDDDGDGRANSVTMYERGQIARVIR